VLNHVTPINTQLDILRTILSDQKSLSPRKEKP
jgi:hypothetical protein